MSLRTLGYVTLTDGDGTNDVGALKQAHIGIALLDGTPEDPQKNAGHQKVETFKEVYESTQDFCTLRTVSATGTPCHYSFIPRCCRSPKKVATDLQAAQKNPTADMRISLIWLRLWMLWLTWKVKRLYLKSSLATPPVQPHSPQSYHHMSLLVSMITANDIRLLGNGGTFASTRWRWGWLFFIVYGIAVVTG